MRHPLQASTTWRTLLLVLTVSLLFLEGRGSSALSKPNELSADKQEDARLVFESLQPGETLQLEMEEIRLDSKLLISASDIVIRGAQWMTTVRCPTEGGAFVITGRNVTLERLVVSGCSDGSAVAVEGRNKAPALGESARLSTASQNKDGAGKWSVVIRDCSFYENTAENGSAIHATGGASVKIERSTFADSSARGYGGSVFVQNSTLLALTSIFSNSSSKEGGAVYSEDGSASFDECSFSENKAERSGGAVNSAFGSANFDNCSFRGNKAESVGGALYSLRGSASFDECSFSENKAERSGGAVNSAFGSANFDNCFFRENNAKLDGGVLDSYSVSVDFDNCTFQKNKAEREGGAVWTYYGSVNFDNCFFRENKAEDGGAVYNRLEPANFDNCSFHENKAERDGGAVYSQYGSTSFDNCPFHENKADHDGGAVYSQYGSTSFENCPFQENKAEDGGALYSFHGSANFDNCSFRGNKAEHDGGAVYSQYGSTSFENCPFQENKAEDGGALYSLRGSASFDECSFSENKAERSGGAVNSDFGSAKFYNCSFRGNKAESVGGALYSYSVSVDFDNCSFQKNKAESEGGAVWTYYGPVNFDNCFFRENKAEGNGGAVYNRLEPANFDNCSFHENKAERDGGAVYSQFGFTSFESCPFHENKAERDGGAVYSYDGSLSFYNCSVRGNKAEGDGGAIRMYGPSSRKGVYFRIMQSALSENSAKNGGAVNIKTHTSEVVRCLFFGNNATASGGALSAEAGSFNTVINQTYFKHNRAKFGGGCSISVGALVRFGARRGEVAFTRNVAHYGGGVGCFGCSKIRVRTNVAQVCLGIGVAVSKTIRFEENVALTMGGGMYSSASTGSEGLFDATFLGNVALFGGGIALEDCLSFQAGAGQFPGRQFSENVAHRGGGLYLNAGNNRLEYYQTTGVSVRSNRALDIEAMRRTNGTFALRRWNSLWEEEASKGDDTRVGCEGCKYGQGGGIFIALHESTNKAAVAIHLQATAVEENSAALGGGVYIENELGIRVREQEQMQCASSLTDGESCLSIQYDDVRIVNNSATLSGGGLFLSASLNLSRYCQMPVSRSKSTCVPQPEAESGEHVWNYLSIKDNRIETDGGSGDNVATDARALELQNVHGLITGLEDGDLLRVPQSGDQDTDSCSGTAIRIAVKDAFNKTIRVANDAELVVSLISDHVSGKREHKAHNGIICIDETSVSGYGVQETLNIMAADRRDLSVLVNFTTVECTNGSLLIEDSSTCFHCEGGSYSFSTSRNDCHKCEDNAVCIGTTVLVPKKGYWHSSPFSPFMHLCLVMEACNFEDRTEKLKEFYDNSSFVQQQLDDFNCSEWRWSEEQCGVRNDRDSEANGAAYKQCKDGYEGVLCGSCPDEYGHTADGKCKSCGENYAASCTVAALVFIAVMLIILVKLYLGIDGVKAEVAYAIAQEKADIRSVFAKASVKKDDSRNVGTTPEATSQVGGVTMNPPTERECASTAADDEGPSQAPASLQTNQPRLTRSGVVEEEALLEDDETAVSPKMKNASSALSDTFNILFNYCQLNSVALTASVGWKGAMKGLLSFQSELRHFSSRVTMKVGWYVAMAGRLLNFNVRPFDCSFPDWKRDRGIPNALLMLWYRTGLPILTMGIYQLGVRIVDRTRPKKRHSKYTMDSLPPAALVALVIYVSYCIDTFANLVKVLHCKRISSSEHPYKMYDVLGEVKLWTGDTAVTCWSGHHLWSAVCAGVGLIALMTIFFFMVTVLWKGKKQNKLADPRFMYAYGVLYLSYTVDGLALYWEAVITLRKIILAAIGEFSKYTEVSGAQMGLAGIVIFAFTVLHQLVHPFGLDDSSETFPSYAGSFFRLMRAESIAARWVAFNKRVTLNGLETASLAMSMSLFFTAASIIDSQSQQDRFSDILGGVCFCLNFIFVAFMVYRLWYGVHHYLDVIAAERRIFFKVGEPNAETDTSLLRKVWILTSTKSPKDEEGDAQFDASLA